METIRARVWVYNRNNGDGSATPLFFTSEEAAEKYASKDDERMCDDVFSVGLEFDAEGNLLNGSDGEEEDL